MANDSHRLPTTTHHCAALLLAAATALGCAAPVGPIDDAEGLGIPLVDPGSPEALGILAFVNLPETTLALLDVDVGLDRRAATNIVAARPFATVAELDAVPYVGRVAMDKLLAWARSGGFIDDDSDVRERAILGLVNDPATSFALLDVDVALDRRAARNIVDARPFATLAQLDAVSYVGATALDKLAAYALANGYGGEPTDPTDPGAPAAPCVLISEYVEGAGRNNKVVEIFNCGAAPVQLDDVGICLVRNDDTECSSHSDVGGGELAPGAVRVLCRTRTGTRDDPYERLAAACEYEIGGAAIFSGDDRLVLFHDLDSDGERDPEEAALDTLGDPAVRPTESIWAEVGLRRCGLAAGVTDTDAVFTKAPRTDMDHLGVAPDPDCFIETRGAAGDDCLSGEGCIEGLSCIGQPSDGSTSYGKCVNPASVPGGGSLCDRHTPCGPGLICAGWTVFGEGDCVPQWMAGRYGFDEHTPLDIVDDGVLDASVVVYGLASVPVDIEVSVHVEHPRKTDLRITLFDPNGDSAVLWDQTTELTEWSRSFVLTGISRDDQVNGEWTLRVEDLVAGETGTLSSFHLFVVSRWD